MLSLNTIDREIFMLKIIRVKNFCVIKFSRIRLIREIFLMVDDCNTDELLESSWRLVYYQVSGEPGNSFRLDIYPGECVDLHANLFTDHRCIILFLALNFHGWSQPQNYFNSGIFPIYGSSRMTRVQ